MQYSESTLYGMNKILKAYVKFPKLLPLPCHFEHGWISSSDTLKSDLQINKPLMLVYSKRRLKAWKRVSEIPAVIVGSLFIHYKNAHKISKKPDAKGTIVFPGHSTEDVNTVFDASKYCKDLKKLPKKFQPITICLFWTDYISRSADVYRKAGFEVVTAGRRYKKGLSFVKNFYKILASHKYASSNEIGSHVFYAVDLGLPFFLTGSAPRKINISGKNIDMFEQVETTKNYYGRRAIKIFSTGPVTKITDKQAKFVRREMGLDDCLKPSEINSLLWQYLKSDPHPVKKTLGYWAISVILFFGFSGFVVSILNFFKRIR